MDVNYIELTKREIDANKAEQTILGQRIALMNDYLNQIPASDPNYSMLLLQVKMDLVEMDELRAREITLAERLKAS